MQINIKKKIWAEDLNSHLSKEERRPTDGHKAHKKMLYITSYYRIANHNYSELSLHFQAWLKFGRLTI